MASAIAAPEAFGASYDVAPASDALELGEGLEGDPAVAFRRTLGMFATGVTVLTARVGEQVHGMTANAFMSVSLQPPLVLISIDRRARMGALLHEGTRFGVSVLEARQTGSRIDSRVARPTTCRRRRSSSFTRRRSSRARSRTSSRASCAPTGAATTRCSSARSSSRATARAGRSSSTAGATSGSSRIHRSFRFFHASCSTRSWLSGRSASTRTESRSCRSGRKGAISCSCSKARHGSNVRAGRLTIGPGELIGEIEVLDPGGGRIADIHAVGPVRTIGVSRQQLLSALEADPRAAIALIEVLAARFRETA